MNEQRTTRRGEFHVTEGELQECQSKCRSCGAAVVFKPSPKKLKPGQAPKTLILSVKSAQADPMGGGYYLLSHFADCPHSKAWKR